MDLRRVERKSQQGCNRPHKARDKPGDYVGLCSLNSGDWIAFYFGILKAGAVAVTLSGLLTGDELAYLINHSKPKVLFTEPSKLKDVVKLKGADCLQTVICPDGDMDLPHLMETGTSTFQAIDRDRLDTAAILYTGGTTGVPKGVMLSHEGMNFAARAIAYYEHSVPTDQALCFLPFNHVFGQNHIMNSTVYSSGCLELLPLLIWIVYWRQSPQGESRNSLLYQLFTSVSSACPT